MHSYMPVFQSPFVMFFVWSIFSQSRINLDRSQNWRKSLQIRVKSGVSTRAAIPNIWVFFWSFLVFWFSEFSLKWVRLKLVFEANRSIWSFANCQNCRNCQNFSTWGTINWTFFYSNTITNNFLKIARNVFDVNGCQTTFRDSQTSHS